MSLGDYNTGRSVGQWITLTDFQDYDELVDYIKDWLKSIPSVNWDSPREEWAVHDSEYFPFGEYPTREEMELWYEMIYSDHDIEALMAYYKTDYNFNLSDFESSYLGQYDSSEDYAMEYAESTGMFNGVSETIEMYFDFEAYGRDMELNGDIEEVNGYWFQRI